MILERPGVKWVARKFEPASILPADREKAGQVPGGIGDQYAGNDRQSQLAIEGFNQVGHNSSHKYEQKNHPQQGVN